MSKFQKNYNFKAKGILYVQDGIICIENDENGELVSIPELLGDFIGRECALSVAYVEDVE